MDMTLAVAPHIPCGLGKSKFVYDLHKADIVRLRVATRVRIQSAGEPRASVDAVGLEIFRGSPAQQVEAASQRKCSRFWEGNMVEHMICEYDQRAWASRPERNCLATTSSRTIKSLILTGNSWSFGIADIMRDP